MKEQDRNLEHFDDLGKLEQLKQEYNNIPVPEAAKARVLAGIKEGKNISEKAESTEHRNSRKKPNHCQCHD